MMLHRMAQDRLVYFLYMTAAVVVVEFFSLLHHLYFLEFSYSDITLKTMVVPAIVGACSGLFVAHLLMLKRNLSTSLNQLLARDRKLEQEISERKKFALREERLDAALMGANDGIWDWNIDNGEMYFSHRWLSMLGYRLEDLSPHITSWEELLHPADKAGVLEILEAHLRGDTDQFKCEFRMRCKDGSWEWVLGRGKVVKWSQDGAPQRAVGTQTKITERKRIEYAMHSLTVGTAPAIGGDFFQELARHLADSLGVPFAMVGMVVPGNANRMRPLAVWQYDRVASAPEYEMNITPCGEVIHRGFTVIHHGVREAFPADELLGDLNAEAYMGVPMYDERHRAIGILAVVDNKPMSEWMAETGRSVLPIFAARATAELQRQRAEAALRAEKERAQVTLYSIADGVITTNASGIVEYLNPAAQAITGWLAEDAMGQSIEQVVTLVSETSYRAIRNPVWVCLEKGHTAELDQHSLLIRSDSRAIAVEALAAPIRSQQKNIGVVMVFRDVSNAREMARQISWQATHDPLTSLFNRKEFERQLNEVIVASRNGSIEHALLYLDLDQFKVVNDTCGHSAGDELLRQLTFLLKEDVRQSDTLARLGGDEFGLLLVGCSQPQAMEIAEKLIATVNAFRFTWLGKSFDIGVSIGMVMINRDVDSLSSVLSAADLACYAAKDMGRNRVHVYQPNDEQLAMRHGEMQWVTHIRQALKDNRFCLYTQRIENLNSDQQVHYEVMVRMLDEMGKTIPPQSFIPAAERYNLMQEIDQWVVKETLRSISTGKTDPNAHYAINLSGKSFGNDGLLTIIRNAMKNYEVDSAHICFEVTETAAIANLVRAVEFMRELKTLGFCFALDDFGSGLSSFAYLKSLPVDFLKIDGSFVKDMVEDPIDCAMVRAINEIGHTMGIKTIAEFVENQETLDSLRHVGVDYAQGYFIERPEPIDQRAANRLVGHA